VAWFAIAMAALGAVLPWSSDGPVRLDGTEGPNNGWLVLIVAALALGCVRSMARGSWVGVLGVLGAGLIIGWTASNSWLDNRHVVYTLNGDGYVYDTASNRQGAIYPGDRPQVFLW